MEVLVVGDLHLRDDEQVSIRAEWSAYDAILLVGDIIDTAATTSSAGAQLLSALGDLSPPTLAVPGNHDHRRHSERIQDIEGVYDLHQKTHSLDGPHSICGLGSTKFDEGPEVRAGPRDRIDEPERVRQMVHQLVETESSIQNTELESSSVTVSGSERMQYAQRIRSLRTLYANSSCDRCVFLTHIPPYNTALDTMQAMNAAKTWNWGSMALRNFLEEVEVELVASGHIHESAGSTVVDGTLCVNPGFRQAVSVDLRAETPSIEDVELEIT